MLDAGAGERVHARYFARQRYVAVDLAVGDADWNYGKLDAIADLTALPFPSDCFAACINIVTLEHVREPACAHPGNGANARARWPLADDRAA